MPLLTVLSTDSQLHFGLRGAIGGDVQVAATKSWQRLSHLVRERPVTGIVIDSAALPSLDDADDTIRSLRSNFPSVGTLLVARADVQPNAIVRLGRAGLTGLALVEFDCLDRDLPREIARTSRRNTTSLVLRQLGARLPAAEHSVVRMALEGVLHGWRAEDLAAGAGWTRAHLSSRMRHTGLPSAGHMLVWAKLMHAGRWLSDPGRTAESISRQLEYSSGAAFRRALQNYVGGTPTWVRDNDGLTCVLSRFLDVCGLDDTVGEFVPSRDGSSAGYYWKISLMKEFTDTDGQGWVATAVEEGGTDYKGRYFLVMRPSDGGEAVELRDVRWNNERTARRSIETMSVVELRRRLRLAEGRHGAVPTG